MLLAQFEPTKTDTALADAYRWCLGAALRLARGGHIPKMSKLALDYTRPKGELLGILASRVRPHVAKFKQGFRSRLEQSLRHPAAQNSSGGLSAAGGSSNTQVRVTNIGSPSATAAALSISKPGVAQTASAAPRTAARPAVAAPAPRLITDREYSETLRLWTDRMRGKYIGGTRFKAALDSMIATVKRDGRTAAFQKMTADLRS